MYAVVDLSEAWPNGSGRRVAAAVTDLKLIGITDAALPDSLGDLSNLASLDLSFNRLAVLPDWLRGLTNLTSLNLSRNRLAALPDWLRGLTNLTSLNLGFNRLAGLPDWLGGLANLTSLGLSGNRLAALPDWLRGLTNLTSLYLGDNKLATLPDSLGELSSLTSLYLNDNELAGLPDWLGGLTNLTSLNLSGNDLAGLPDRLGELTNLTEFDLSGNELATVPDWLGELTNLNELDLSRTKLAALPDWLGELTNLTSLNLSGNRLAALPDRLGGLTNLTKLGLSGNELATLPDSLGDLRTLTSLGLSGNRLAALPDWLGGLTNLTSLNFSDNKIPTLPDSLGDLSNLTSLDLSGNWLAALPDWLGELTNLTDLDLSRNGPAALPDSLVDLSNLTSLDLSFNGLAALPDWLGELTNLTELGLSANRLAALPDWLGGLTNLTRLILSRNELAALPDWLGGLTNLTELSLSRNRLTALPDPLGDLANLTELDLSHNRLTTLPDSIGDLPALERFRCTTEGLKNLPTWLVSIPYVDLVGDVADLPPEQAAALHAGELQPFLKAVALDGVEIAEGKLVLVGEGEAGKSTLLAALRDEPFDPDRLATHGLDVKTVRLGDLNSVLDFRAWDFGGQPQYRSSHQLFFSSSAVYLVVWRPRVGPETGQVKYWIDLIRHRAGPEVPILVVATHGDTGAPAPDLDESLLRVTYGDAIQTVIQVGSRDGTNIAELAAAILSAATRLPHIVRTVPRRWTELHELLTGLDDPYITRDSFLARALSFGLSEAEARSLAVVGHTLGWWVYYDNDPELRELLVLKGDWLSTAIALVLDDLPTRQHGLLDHARLADIWNNQTRPPNLRYPRYLHPLFLHLMERFDIGYPAPPKANRPTVSVIPQLLPIIIGSLDRIWDGMTGSAQATAFCRPVVKGGSELAIPEGILSRFIARNHWLSLGSEDLDEAVHWRGGVVLQNRYGARALVQLQPDGISITARGPDPSAFVRDLLESLRDLVSDFWPGLSTKILLPCTSCEQERVFDLDSLYARLQNDRNTAECHTCYRLVPVLRLLAQLPNAVPGEQDDQLKHLLAAMLDLDNQVRQQRETDATIGDDLRLALQRLASQADVNMRGILGALADEGRHGPRLFTATQLDRTLRHPAVTHLRVRVTLYCEHSMQAVHVLEDDNSTGIIDIDVPKDWWRKAAPWIRRVAAVLSTAAPIFKEALSLSYDDPGWKGIEEQVGLGREIISGAERGTKAITDGGSDPRFDRGDSNDTPTVITGPIRAEGGDLRRFQDLLKERDPSFGDLRLVQGSPDYMWVHRSFEYKYTKAVPSRP